MVQARHQIGNWANSNGISDRHQVKVASPVLITAQRQGPGRLDGEELLAECADDALCYLAHITLAGRWQPSQRLRGSLRHIPASERRWAASVGVSAASGSAPTTLALLDSHAAGHTTALHAD